MNNVKNLMIKYFETFPFDKKMISMEHYIEYFVDLEKILTVEKRNGASIDELLASQKIGFQIIHDGMRQI